MMRLFTSLFLVVAAAAGTAAGGGCTYVVLSDAQGDKACDDAADCAAGFACADGACDAVARATAPPPVGTLVGPEGGTVQGPDGLTVVFPPGSLDTPLHVTVSRRSSTTVPVGVIERSRFYVVEPAAVLVAAAAVSVPLTAPCPDATCAVWLAPDDDGEPWIDLESRPEAGELVTGELPVLGGVIVAGEAE
jgi:hypothetical protein